MVIQRIIVSANIEFLCDIIFDAFSVTFKFFTIMTLRDSHKITKSVTKFWIRIKRTNGKHNEITSSNISDKKFEKYDIS